MDHLLILVDWRKVDAISTDRANYRSCQVGEYMITKKEHFRPKFAKKKQHSYKEIKAA